VFGAANDAAGHGFLSLHIVAAGRPRDSNCGLALVTEADL
jgi:hypothetical protein